MNDNTRHLMRIGVLVALGLIVHITAAQIIAHAYDTSAWTYAGAALVAQVACALVTRLFRALVKGWERADDRRHTASRYPAWLRTR